MDKLSSEQRHRCMSAIRSWDTKVEVRLRKALWHEGIRYRKNYRVLGYQVDIAITKYRLAVFCDGEFWHGKAGDGSQVRTNTQFWQNKIRRNMERDLEAVIALRDGGWQVVRFWEKDILQDLAGCVEEVKRLLALTKSLRCEAR